MLVQQLAACRPPACMSLKKYKMFHLTFLNKPKRNGLNFIKKNKTNLTPSTIILLVNAEAALTIVRHSLALVDHNMDIVRGFDWSQMTEKEAVIFGVLES